ncbi:MAG: class I SAM-dependent methyltransferase, partial [Arcobacter sp.]|nr:class I SAM-dependent methyltransferase [Arcobacter sp.]
MNNLKSKNLNLKMQCPLCDHDGQSFYQNDFYLCEFCGGIFKDKVKLLNIEQEKQRYKLHNDNITDIGYQHFVSPIINNVFKSFSIEAKGLDFGAGHTAIIAKLLQEKGFEIKIYDPFFYPILENLEQKYDFVTACEVIEHFYSPKKEFALLKSLLHKDGILYCMTHIYDESIDFGKWYYKNDPTHVFIYQAKTIEYIKNNF